VPEQAALAALSSRRSFYARRPKIGSDRNLSL